VRKLIILPSAEADLRDIGDFIAQNNLDAAIAFVERLNQAYAHDTIFGAARVHCSASGAATFCIDPVSA
jgi:plasmid stabilization system protein ParE